MWKMTRISALETTMKRILTKPEMLAEARMAIEAALMDRPLLTIPELPHKWPKTRSVVLAALREMIREGAVAPVPGGWIPGQTAYALTDAGRRIAKERGDDAFWLPDEERAQAVG